MVGFDLSGSLVGLRDANASVGAQGRGNETHVPLMTKIKRALGIRSTPRRDRPNIHSVTASGTRARRGHNKLFRRRV